MGIANAQRMLDYIRIITEFISQPEYANLIPMFGIINEGESACRCGFSLRLTLSSTLEHHRPRPAHLLVRSSSFLFTAR
jgi:hypothetical protein